MSAESAKKLAIPAKINSTFYINNALTIFLRAGVHNHD